MANLKSLRANSITPIIATAGITSTPADGSITTAKLANNAVTSIKIASGTDYTPIALGNTAQRPAAAANGYTRYNTTTNFMETYYNSNWISTTVSILAGQSANNPAVSAAAIKAATGTTIDGFYWISLPTAGPTQVWCDMNTNGGGWMLAAKVYNNTTKFNGYSSTDWTSVGVINASEVPGYAGHIKTDVYNYWVPTTGVRLSGGAVSNNLYEAWTGQSMISLLNSATVNSQNSRALWLSWGISAASFSSTIFDNQPNCNQAGTNKSYGTHSVRIGISMNNENDCNSNDSSVGFGGTFGPCGWYSFSPNATGMMVGWIWVK
jgi:hypothetical protein